jgi:hypothetical protein
MAHWFDVCVCVCVCVCTLIPTIMEVKYLDNSFLKRKQGIQF